MNTTKGKQIVCSRGHKYSESGPCPICWPGRMKQKDIWKKETPPAKDVDAFIKASPSQTQAKLKELRQIVCAVAPDAIEAISYKMPAYKYNGKWLVGFAGFKNHVSLFGMSGTFFDTFKDKLKNYKTSKGTLQFPLDKPLPAALIKMLVKARMRGIVGPVAPTP